MGRVLAILRATAKEESKAAVLNSSTSKSGQRSYDRAISDFVDWYCSEPRLAFNRSVVLRYRIFLEQKRYATTTINLRLAAVRRVAFEAADSGLLSPELAAESWGEPDPLTDRERQVLRLAGDGMGSGDIAVQLSLSEGTVRNYLSEAISKLGAANRVEAARIARTKGWL